MIRQSSTFCDEELRVCSRSSLSEALVRCFVSHTIKEISDDSKGLTLSLGGAVGDYLHRTQSCFILGWVPIMGYFGVDWISYFEAI